jgi:hypothetical protein
LTALGHRVHAIVNYDNLELGPTADETFFTMIRDSTETFLQRHALLHERHLPPPTRPTLHPGTGRPTRYPDFAAARNGRGVGGRA